MGRTSQHLTERIRQHVPLHLLTSDSQRSSRPRRGRPPKTATAHVSETVPSNDDIDQTRRGRPHKTQSSSKLVEPPRTRGRAQVMPASSVPLSTNDYASSIAKHLAQNSSCCEKYADDCFTVLASARSPYLLAVIEALLIQKFQPSLCLQKTQSVTLNLFGQSNRQHNS